jgi:hypothetical protein
MSLWVSCAIWPKLGWALILYSKKKFTGTTSMRRLYNHVVMFLRALEKLHVVGNGWHSYALSGWLRVSRYALSLEAIDWLVLCNRDDRASRSHAQLLLHARPLVDLVAGADRLPRSRPRELPRSNHGQFTVQKRLVSDDYVCWARG